MSAEGKEREGGREGEGERERHTRVRAHTHKRARAPEVCVCAREREKVRGCARYRHTKKTRYIEIEKDREMPWRLAHMCILGTHVYLRHLFCVSDNNLNLIINFYNTKNIVEPDIEMTWSLAHISICSGNAV
jgi:hypothetical protein